MLALVALLPTLTPKKHLLSRASCLALITYRRGKEKGLGMTTMTCFHSLRKVIFDQKSRCRGFYDIIYIVQRSQAMTLHTWPDSSHLFLSIKLPPISSQSTSNKLDLSYNFSQTHSSHNLSKMQLFGYISAVFLAAITVASASASPAPAAEPQGAYCPGGCYRRGIGCLPYPDNHNGCPGF